MKTRLIIALSAALLLSGTALTLLSSDRSLTLAELQDRIEDLDLIFQESRSAQAPAIQEATGSAWTHMGLVVWQNDRPGVLEAGARGVAWTDLESFVNAGKGRRVAILRLRDQARLLTPETRKTIGRSLQEHVGKRYDGLFQWSEDRIYCSQLVWLAFQDADIELGNVQPIGELNLDGPAAQRLLKERYRYSVSEAAQAGLLDEKIITPVSLYEDPNLTTVFEGKVK